jgi:hypothetical protein
LKFSLSKKLTRITDIVGYSSPGLEKVSQHLNSRIIVPKPWCQGELWVGPGGGRGHAEYLAYRGRSARFQGGLPRLLLGMCYVCCHGWTSWIRIIVEMLWNWEKHSKSPSDWLPSSRRLLFYSIPHCAWQSATFTSLSEVMLSFTNVVLRLDLVLIEFSVYLMKLSHSTRFEESMATLILVLWQYVYIFHSFISFSMTVLFRFYSKTT